MPTLEQFVSAVASFVTERSQIVSRTKLLKLLYLFDVEYYRLHRRTFTGFNWKYLHLGPWAQEFDPMMEKMESLGLLVPTGKYSSFRAPEFTDSSTLFGELADDRALRSVLRLWGEAGTPEILDHVYFETEPMIEGVRGERLNFATIPAMPPLKYRRTSSGVSSTQIKELKKKLPGVERSADVLRTADLPPEQQPTYDNVYFDTVAALSTAEE